MKNKYYTSRDPIKNYFPLPNEVFALGLSPGALAVYSYLMYIEDRTTYQCHASYKTIGNAVNMSPNTVRKYVTELVERGLIQTERTTIITQDGRKQNGSLLYTLLHTAALEDPGLRGGFPHVPYAAEQLSGKPDGTFGMHLPDIARALTRAVEAISENL